jgi:hypothetical protein
MSPKDLPLTEDLGGVFVILDAVANASLA